MDAAECPEVKLNVKYRNKLSLNRDCFLNSGLPCVPIVFPWQPVTQQLLSLIQRFHQMHQIELSQVIELNYSAGSGLK